MGIAFYLRYCLKVQTGSKVGSFPEFITLARHNVHTASAGFPMIGGFEVRHSRIKIVNIKVFSATLNAIFAFGKNKINGFIPAERFGSSKQLIGRKFYK